MKLMEISNCYRCHFIGTLNCRDHFCNKSSKRKLEGNIFKSIPDWCELPNASRPGNTAIELEWKKISTDGYPRLGTRVLTYSDIYENLDKDVVRVFRIIDAQFVKKCKDVTHWMYIEIPDREPIRSEDTAAD